MVDGTSKRDIIELKAKRLKAARTKKFPKRPALYQRYSSWVRRTFESHEDGSREFDRDAAEIYAKAFDVSVAHLLALDILAKDTSNVVALPKRPIPNASFPPKYQAFDGDSSTPLLGQVAAGPNGRFILNGSEIGRVFTPPSLEGVEGAYAVRVYGTSMEPRYEAGETVWLNPHEPVRAGDDVVVQLIGEDDERESYIKRFVSQSSRVTKLFQWNPDEGESQDLEFDSSRVFSIHKVVFHATV